MKILSIHIILLTLSLAATAQQLKLSSPDKHIQFSFSCKNGTPQYSVAYDQQPLIKPSTLELSFKEQGNFGNTIKMGKPIITKEHNDYTLIVGKTSEVHDVYNQAIIPLQQKQSPGLQVNIEVRIFNDGLAFRYRFPQQANWQQYLLTEENTTFHFAGDPSLLTSFLPNYTTSHEARHEQLSFSSIKPDTLMDMPLLVTFPNHIYMGITEAALVDYAGMYLVKKGDHLVSDLSPLPGEPGIKVKATLPHQSPWRVLLISKRVGALIESNIITSLNEPTTIKDLSWLQPGTSDFHWWNGDILPDTTFPPQSDFLFNKYYIDFCARHHITYHSVIGYGGYPWYVSDAEGYGVIGPNTDVTKTIPTINMKEICDYATTQGVGIRVWVHWQALYPNIEKAFTQFEQWGIKGMMVDFMDRDDQEMVNIQIAMLQSAARHHLHIQFHGAFKPTGLHRTYPNEFTREGTLNYEGDKWGNIITPDDDISIPFTRLLAGATDYHLGGFRAVPQVDYKIHYTRPLVVGTRCHMLAMYIVLESYLQMVCDYPDAYEGQPGFELLETLPTTWDETRVLTAEPNQYIAIARRKGRQWYIGIINNQQARQLSLPLGFLGSSSYQATLYTDAANSSQQPNQLNKKQQALTASDTLTINLAAGGGAVVVLEEK